MALSKIGMEVKGDVSVNPRPIDLNARISNDIQVIREGADINVLHDDFVPLSRILSTCLKVLSTFSLFLFISITAAYLSIDPETVDIEATDTAIDIGLKVAAQYAQVEFTWGLLMGILATTGIIAIALKLYRLRRKQGWTTISSPYELEALLAIRPVFGTPQFSDRSDLDDIKSHFSESMVSLESLLEQKFQNGIPKVIVVMSSQPSEGKTTLALGLSRSLSRSGRRVLLVDGDLRNPTLSRSLKLESSKGLSNVLSDNDFSSENSIVSLEGNVAFLPSGPMPPDPPQLLKHSSVRILIEKACRTYDHVIVDTTPVLGLADATRWSPFADVILYALEANRTWVYHAVGAIRRLGAGIDLIPVVTKIPIKQFGYTYGYGYAYGYGYGADTEEKGIEEP